MYHRTAKKFILIADYRKNSIKFGDSWKLGIPIEVLPSAYKMIQSKIENKYNNWI